MPDTPDGTGNDSFASLDDAMANWTDEEDQANPETDTQQASEQDMPDTPDGEGDQDNPDDAGQAGEDQQDGPDDYSGGRFAADDAKVRNEDGSWTTVGELRKGSLRQQDYTHKAMALSEERRSFDADRQRVQSLASELQQQRELVAYFAQTFMPQPPDPKMLEEGDIVGFNLAQAAFQQQTQKMGQLRADYQAYVQRQQAEQQEAMKQTVAREREALASRAPNLVKNYSQFWAEAVKAGAHYGYTEPELAQLTDHRHYLILSDALAYRRIKAKNAQAGQQPQTQRPVVRGGRSGTSGTAQQQASAAARARFNKNPRPTIKDALDLNF